MGRRALRKTDPSLDLSQHLQALANLAFPFDPQRVFGRTSPLELEVGSGKGLFLSQAAPARPAHDFLGIEMSGKYARFTAAKLARLRAANAIIVHGDALRLFREGLADASAVAVHVYFPDPWWKKRHKKRRVMKEAFLADVERVLEPHGRLHFWTDVEEYFLSTLELIVSTTSLGGPYEVPEPAAEAGYRTHYERRSRLLAARVFRAEFRKLPASGHSAAPTTCSLS